MKVFFCFIKIFVIFACAYETNCHAHEIMMQQSAPMIHDADIKPSEIGALSENNKRSKTQSSAPEIAETASATRLDSRASEPVSPSKITPEHIGIASAIADGLTTHLAFSTGAVEANPMINSSPVGLIVLTGMKIGLIEVSETFEKSGKRVTQKSLSSLWSGAAVNNMLVYLSAAQPFSVVAGLVMAFYTWNNIENKYLEEDRLREMRKENVLDLQADVAPRSERIRVE